MNHAGIRSALSRIAWAYLLIHLHFRLNNLDLLPDWAGYLLIFSAIGLLAGELRDLPLLRPFCILLGGFVLLLADTVGRCVVPPNEISASIIMSIVGGPFFIILLKRGDRHVKH